MIGDTSCDTRPCTKVATFIVRHQRRTDIKAACDAHLPSRIRDLTEGDPAVVVPLD